MFERFEPEAEVLEVTRELGGGGVCDRRAVRGVSSEQQHPGQLLGRRGPCHGFIEHPIRLCQVFRGGWPSGQCLGTSELEEHRKPLG